MRWRKLYEVGKTTIVRYLDNGGPLLAGALAFHSLVSIAPLVLVAVAVAGLAFGEEAAAGRLQEQLQHYIGKDAAHAVNTMVDSLRDAQTGTHNALIGTALALFTAARLFSHMQDAINQLWRVRTEYKSLKSGVLVTLYKKGIALGLVVLLGGLFTAFLIAMAIASAAKSLLGDTLPGSELMWQATPLVCTTVLVAILFAMVYRWVPNARISWRDAAWGAGVAAVLFVAAEYPLSYYLAHGAITTVSGVAGSLVVFLFWVYYSAQIFFVGAQLSRVCADLAGRVPEPDEIAVIIKEVPMDPKDQLAETYPPQSEQLRERPSSRETAQRTQPSLPGASG